MKLNAYAKLNMSLDVLGKRRDGFHDLKMVMASADLHDDITLTRGGKGISLSCSTPFLPCDGRNHAVKAANAFFASTGIENDGLNIEIVKRIPICAGLGGGSSDAAAVIKGLNLLYGAGLSTDEMMKIGFKVGADVPYCILGGTALAEGRGELLTPLKSLPSCFFVICKPRESHSTAAFFSKIDSYKTTRRPDTPGILAAIEIGDLKELCHRMYNVFGDLPDWGGSCAEIERTLIRAGALGAVMSGTGSAVFGVFESLETAEKAKQKVSGLGDAFLCRPVG